MYKIFFRLVFTRMDPEQAHYLAFRWIRLAAGIPVLRTFVAAALAPRHKELRTEAFGLRMHGPFGLAAGFDKNAVAIDGMSMLGFDHVEIGTVTGEAQPGNPKKRLFRLVQDRALINRMGFNNDGSLAVGGPPGLPTPGLQDGRRRQHRQDEGRPRGGGRRRLREVDRAARASRRLPRRQRVVARTRRVCATCRPWTTCARCSPPSARPPTAQCRRAAGPAARQDRAGPRGRGRRRGGRPGRRARPGRHHRHQHHHRARGLGLQSDAALVEETGGLSGAPLKERSLEVLRRLYARVGDRITLVGVGGIENAEDAWQRILAGATLVQGYSAFIYEGPFWMPRHPQGPRGPPAQQPLRHAGRSRRRSVSDEDRKQPQHDPGALRRPSAPAPWTSAGRSASASTRTPRCSTPGV